MKESDFFAKIILFSRPSEGGPNLITIHVRYPRIIHAELMTHRVFGRNARSSRAVPVKNLLAETVYIPHFMKNKAGMSASEEFSPDKLEELQERWLQFAKQTQEFQQYLVDEGVHKQWANRPGEWFGYIDVLITATEWANFFALRIHPAAQPEIQRLAETMDKEIKRVIRESKYQILQPGEWHIPYITKEEFDHLYGCNDMSLKLSVARCARISYEPFDGDGTMEKELARHDLLRYNNPIHASPFEHQAQLLRWHDDYELSNLRFPWLQYRKVIGE